MTAASPCPHDLRAERWLRVKHLLADALERPPAAREAGLLEACGGDAGLLAELRGLLQQTLDASFLEPAAAIGEDDESGLRIGAWRLTRLLGHGGMGSVYEAAREDGHFEQRCALKLIRRAAGREAGARFLRERQILARLEHPNIVRLVDGGLADDGRPYLVMALIVGEPLDRWCAGRPLAARLAVLAEVADAVEHAHRHLLVHRDLKPGNILVDAQGQPHLLDFGIAKLLDDAQDPALTQEAWRPLTPRYSSPEQAGGAPVTTGSDVFALGLLLYEVCTGRHPFGEQANALSQLRALHECEPEPPSRSVAALAGDMDAIILTALAREPARRYATAGALAQDLRRHLAGLPVAARAPTWFYVCGRWLRRHRVAAAAALLTLLALIGGGAVAMWQAQVAEAQRAKAEQRFNAVRQLAHAVVFDYHDAIEQLSGSVELRRRLVQDALVYLDGLARDAAHDASLQLELAAAYEKIGDVQGRWWSSNLGQTAEARLSYAKARAIRDELRRTQPQHAANLRELAGLAEREADQLAAGGALAPALQRLDEAVSLGEQAVAAAPADPQARHTLAHALLWRADLAGIGMPSLNRFELAEASLQAALRHCGALAAAQPANVTLAVEHAVAQRFAARFYRRGGQWTLAERHADAALALLGRALREHPDNVYVAADLAATKLERGRLQELLQGPDAALPWFQQARREHEPLFKANAGNAGAARYFGLMLEGEAATLIALGRHAEAAPLVQHYLQVVAPLAQGSPGQLMYERAVLLGRQHEAMIAAAGHQPGAPGLLRAVLEGSMALAGRGGGDVSLRMLAERQRLALADALAPLQSEAAQAQLDLAIGSLGPLHAQAPAYADLADLLAQAHYQRARLGRADAAADRARALALWTGLAQRAALPAARRSVLAGLQGGDVT